MKKWKITKPRGRDYRVFLDLVNHDLTHGGGCCQLDSRGPGFPQRIVARVPGGRTYRLTLKPTSVRLSPEQDNFVPITTDDILKMEWLEDSEWEEEHAGREATLAAVLTGEKTSITLSEVCYALDLTDERFERIQAAEPELFAGPIIDCTALRDWLDRLPEMWAAQCGGGQ